MKKRVVFSPEVNRTREVLRKNKIHSVCQDARCPNISECFSQRTATFMILGNLCTRNCAFCAVGKGKPERPDPLEPERLAGAALELGLKHVVITSVTRDDLLDGGAGHFALVIEAVRVAAPGTVIEVLVPDFAGLKEAVSIVTRSRPDIINHNLETVPRLYQAVRPQAVFSRSLQLLAKVKELDSRVYTKSGIMVGLGENFEEVLEVMAELRQVSCDYLTIGQYLQPSAEHYPLQEFVAPEIYQMYREKGLVMGFKDVAAGPYVRSSYHAGELFETSLRQ